MKLLEVGQVIDLNIRRTAKELIELGNDRLEGMSWLNERFYAIASVVEELPSNDKGLIKQTELFAEFYVVFMENSEKFFDKVEKYRSNISNKDFLDAEVLDTILLTNTQQKLKFSQVDLENLFDAVSIQMTPNMSKAISQRANKHYKSSINNESFYDNLWGRSRT